MHRSYLPFLFMPSAAAQRLLGKRGADAAVLALKAVVANGRSLEVAHQQIHFGGNDYAFSSRIGADGTLIVDLDVGDARLGDRIVLEEELRTAGRNQRGIAAEHRAARARAPRRG